jgi:hypothetical protein
MTQGFRHRPREIDDGKGVSDGVNALHVRFELANEAGMLLTGNDLQIYLEDSRRSSQFA